MAMNEDDIYTFNLVGKNSRNEIQVNTFAFRVAAVTTPADEDSYLESLFNWTDGAFRTRIALPFAEVMSEQVVFTHWDVQKVKPVEMQPRRYAGQLPGQNETTISTFNTAVSVTRYGDEGGRRNRGRIAMGGICDEHYDQGLIGPASLVLFRLASSGIVGEYVATAGLFTLQLGFYVPAHSAIVGGVPTTYPAKFTHCTRTIVREQVRVQRSRTIGVGR